MDGPVELGLVASRVRAGHPDFLDLPWARPLASWPDAVARLERLPRGLSRHEVVFANYDGVMYALKELPPEVAEREFDRLRTMEELRLPAVTPIGHVQVRTDHGPTSVVITRYLDHALPYHSLFMQRSLVRYRDHLLDAMALLLVQLHLAGVYWGDCSLSNTLFRRDAGRLTAYLVDAETAEIHPELGARMREADLEIMEENVAGGLLDLDALGALPPDLAIAEIGPSIRRRYHDLWTEITAAQIIAIGERYRIQERVRRLNDLGFSVDQIELEPVATGDKLRLRAQVTDRNFHRNLLHSLTGLDPEEMQARAMLNEIQQFKAALSTQTDRSTPLSVAAHRWLHEVYQPVIDRLPPVLGDPAETYCEILDHKWYLSERRAADVGMAFAVEDFLRREGGGADTDADPDGGRDPGPGR